MKTGLKSSTILFSLIFQSIYLYNISKYALQILYTWPPFVYTETFGYKKHFPNKSSLKYEVFLYLEVTNFLSPKSKKIW